MRDFGSWFSEQGSEPKEIVGSAWLECSGCGKWEMVNLKSYVNGDTGWYVDDEVEPDGTYEGVCGGSDRCLP